MTEGPAAEGVPVGRRRRREPAGGMPWETLRCTMCDGADAFQAQDSRGLLLHMSRAHLGQQLRAETVAQLRHLDKAACRVCSGIRARLTPWCQHCRCTTATRPLQLGDSLPDRRRGNNAMRVDQAGPENAAHGATDATPETGQEQEESAIPVLRV
eukprot:258911-Karenia_brevis.AAC.1